MSEYKSLEEMVEQMQKLVDLKDQIEGYKISASVERKDHKKLNHQVTFGLTAGDTALFYAVAYNELDELADDDKFGQVIMRMVNIYARLTEEEKREIEKRPLRIVVERE
jgi:hypothetical protein